MKLHCAVTHIDEPVLDACLDRLRGQSIGSMETTVVSGLSPACNAFNAALDAGLEAGADVLVHLAADVFLEPFAIERLLAPFQLDNHYAVTGLGYDIFNGYNAPVGLWALNLRVIADRFRFRDVYKMDMEFCERIEAETGLTCVKSPRGVQLAYHHPIWTPRELFIAFRYNAAKYSLKHLKKYQDFLDAALRLNPDNKALRAGLIAIRRGAAEPIDKGSPNRSRFDDEWADVCQMLQISGREFFVQHSEFVEMARALLNSAQEIVPPGGSYYEACEKAPSNSKAAQASDGPRKRRLPTNPINRASRKAKRLLLPFYLRTPEPLKQIYRQLRSRARANREERLRIAADLPHLEYGAITTGVPEWAAKWRATARNRRVLMIAPKDFAGSMYKWAEAVNRHTDFAVRLITFKHHQYYYPVDLVIPECDPRRMDGVMTLVEEAGIFHLKDEHSWFLRAPTYVNLSFLDTVFFSREFGSRPKLFTHYGGYARKLKNDRAYIAAVQKFDGRIAMTPDINFDWFRGEYIPHTIDTATYQSAWSDSRVFAHSPSSPEKKGTYLFEEAVMMLERHHPDLWRNWKVDLISGISFDECMRRKQQASIFFDQAGRHRVASLGIDDVIGWYGNSAIEAMAFGIPTMAHLSEAAFEGAERAGIHMQHCPIINIDRTRDSLMSAFLAFARADPAEREVLSERTRAFTVSFHGYEVVAHRLGAAYRNFLSDVSNQDRRIMQHV